MDVFEPLQHSLDESDLPLGAYVPIAVKLFSGTDNISKFPQTSIEGHQAFVQVLSEHSKLLCEEYGEGNCNEMAFADKINICRRYSDDHGNPFASVRYSQIQHDWDSTDVRQILKRLNLEIDGSNITVVAGFVGEYAKLLAALGGDVYFTDPLECWVEYVNKTAGLDGCVADILSLPRHSVVDADILTSFESYPVFFAGFEQFFLLAGYALNSTQGFVHVETASTMESRRRGYKKTVEVTDVFNAFTQAFNGSVDSVMTSDTDSVKVSRMSGQMTDQVDCMLRLVRSLKQGLEENKFVLDEKRKMHIIDDSGLSFLCDFTGYRRDIVEDTLNSMIDCQREAWEMNRDMLFLYDTKLEVSVTD